MAHKYGHYASWAVWAEPSHKPKSNVGDLSVLDPSENPHLLERLNPGIVMVGLNFSRSTSGRTFGNFHDSRPQGQDYKIRYAFNNTEYCGAYMTDIIKDFEQLISGKVMSHLKKHPDFEAHNVRSFEAELFDLGGSNPLIIAFGSDVYTILNRNLKGKLRIVQVTHYSHYISKEDYRSAVLTQLNSAGQTA